MWVPLLVYIITLPLALSSAQFFSCSLRARGSDAALRMRVFLCCALALAVHTALTGIFGLPHTAVHIGCAAVWAASLIFMLQHLTTGPLGRIFALIAAFAAAIAVALTLSGAGGAGAATSLAERAYRRLAFVAIALTILALLPESLTDGLNAAETASRRRGALLFAAGAQTLSAGLFIVILGEANSLEKGAFLSMLFSYVGADIALLRAIGSRKESAALEEELRLLAQQRSMQDEYRLAVDDQLQRSQRLKHDLTNTLQTVHTLIGIGRTDDAQAIVEQCLADASARPQVLCTGNDVVDAIINNKAAEAQEAGIRFTVNLLLPESFPPRNLDTVRVLSNLLDNAIAYCKTLPVEFEPRIAVSSEIAAGIFILQVMNTCPSVRYGFLPPLQKQQSEGEHGHGIDIVRDIVKRYDGALTFSACGDMLCATATGNFAGLLTARRHGKTQ